MTVLKAFSSLAVVGVFCSFLSCYGMQMPGQPPDDRRSGGDSASMSSLDVFLNAGKRAAEGLSLQKRNGSVSTAEDKEIIDGRVFTIKELRRKHDAYVDEVRSAANSIFSFLEGRRVQLITLIGRFKKLGVDKKLLDEYERAHRSSTDAADVEESSQKEESSQQGSDELASSVADDTSEQPVAKKGKLSRGREGKKPKK